MSIRSRNLLATAFLVVILVAIPAAGVVQTIWLTSAADGEQARLSRALSNASLQIRADLAVELASLRTLVSPELQGQPGAPSDQIDALYRSFHEYYDVWAARSRFPGLISRTVFVGPSSDWRPMEYDPVAGSFSEAEGPHPEWITSVIPNLPGAAVAQPPASLVMSIPLDRAFPRSAGQATQPGAGYLLMELDELYLATTVLPDLVDNYLGTGEYHVSIVRGSAETPVWSYPDGSSPEYEYLTRDNADEVILVSLFPGAAADPVPARADPATWASGEILRRLQDPLVQEWLGFRYRRERELSLGSDVTRPDGGLSILVRHSSGSIGAAVRVGLNRNLGISYAALAVLAGAAIVYHAMFRRANRQRIREHEFVATVTHELRTPVAAIHAVADNLADGIVTESAQVRSYGDALLDEGKRLRDLIDQVLLYAGLQREGGKPHRSHVRVQELVNRACSRVPEIQPDRLTVHFESAAPVFRGDPVAVESVLSNLLSNAFKHNPQSTFVTLDVRTVPGPIRRSSGQGVILEITVSDDGRGISRSELRRVREPFFRGAQTQADQVPGSGLGLSLVRRIATVCRGTLEITSSPGKGTTAVVLLRFESGVGDES